LAMRKGGERKEAQKGRKEGKRSVIASASGAAHSKRAPHSDIAKGEETIVFTPQVPDNTTHRQEGFDKDGREKN